MRTLVFRAGWFWAAAACTWAVACGTSSKDASKGTDGSRAGKAAAGTSSAGSSGGHAGDASTTGGVAGSNGGKAGRGGEAGLGAAGDGASGEAAGNGESGTSGSAEAGEAGARNAGTGGANGGRGGTFAFGGEAGAGETDDLRTNKIDLLFVVDNSISMYEKQALFSATLPRFVSRLVDPWCTDDENPPLAPVGVACPSGTHREMAPVTDMHIGVITTSLGAHGSHDVCSEEQAAAYVAVGDPAPFYDDHGRLLPTVRLGLPSWNGSGFLKWDPQGAATPPGHNDAAALIDDVREVIAATRATGCGYESTLEAAYRFLSDPEPPLVIDNDGSSTLVSTDVSNIDQDLLEQRAAFLRPDSAVVVVSLSDEDDCSINDDALKQGFLTGYKGGVGVLNWHMPRGSASCDDPNDPCCRPCTSPPASGCPDNASDSACALGDTLGLNDDSMNLRCFAQVERFGISLLYPLSRYENGFTGASVPRRSGGTAPNPLLAGGRDPRLVIYAPIVGVPWQDLALDPEDPDTIDLASARQLRDSGRWPVLVGDIDAGVAPLDPFMLGSVTPRSVGDENPFTGAPIVGDSSTNPLATINGHECTPSISRDDLQYACIFPLPAPIPCDSENPDGCDCDAAEIANNRPVCQPPEGGPAVTTQYFGKAYPGIRHLEVARRVGDQAIPASICARDTTHADRDDYGYVPAMRAIQARLTRLLAGP